MRDMRYLIGLLAVVAVLAILAVTFSADRVDESVADNESPIEDIGSDG